MSGVQAFPKPQYDEAIPAVKYGEAFPEEKYDEAIPEAEFAKVIKETIPIVQFLSVEDEQMQLLSAEDGEAQSMSVEDGETNVIYRILSFLTTTTFPDSRFNRKWKEDNI